MIKKIVLAALLFNAFTAFGQAEKVYPFFLKIIEANQEITHISTPISYRFLKSPNYKKRVMNLTEAEGGEGYIVEPNIDLNFPLLQGKGTGRPFWNASRLSINYGFHTRVIKTNSSPILPPTNRVGIRLEKIIWENVCTKTMGPWSFKEANPDMPEKDKDIHLTYFSFLFEHYSNGQNGEKLVENQNRNNYLNGDFSTNFARFDVIYSGLFKNRTLLLTAGLGAQIEMGRDDGFFAFFDEQIDRYGKFRLRSLLQVRLPPIANTHELRIRLQNEYIFCACEKYPYAASKYRFSSSLYLDYNPLNLRTIGVLLHFYHGRDYLNIRYDDPVFIAQLGFSIAINKYNPLKE